MEHNTEKNRDYAVLLNRLHCISGVDICLMTMNLHCLVQCCQKNKAGLDQVSAIACQDAVEHIRNISSPSLNFGSYYYHRVEELSFFSMPLTLKDEGMFLLFGPLTISDRVNHPLSQNGVRCFSWKEIQGFLPLLYELTPDDTSEMTYITDLKSDWEAGVAYNDRDIILHNAQREKMLLDAIRLGDISQLRRIFLSDSFLIPEHYQQTASILRRMKNICISFNTLCFHAASDAGCPIVYTRSIAARFVEQIENCQTTDQVNNLRKELAYFYCEKAHEAQTSKYGQQMRMVISYIRDNMSEEIRLPDIADRLHISPETLSRRINQEYPSGFSALVNQLRIQRACQYLHLSLTISEVAERVGYKSSSQFCRQFKAIMGETPARWRENEPVGRPS